LNAEKPVAKPEPAPSVEVSKPLEFTNIQWAKSEDLGEPVIEVSRWEEHEGELIVDPDPSYCIQIGKLESSILINTPAALSAPEQTTITTRGLKPSVEATDTGWRIHFAPVNRQ
jgi:hypothetical protein